MSAFGGKADIVIAKCPRPKSGFVRYCPKADIVSAFCGDPGAASLIGAAIFDNGTRTRSNFRMVQSKPLEVVLHRNLNKNSVAIPRQELR